MSGFVGILHLDGSPVDRDVLQRLTNFQKFRGPDAQQIWVGGHLGFGHTLLKTGRESEHERQPFSLKGETCVVADCRVDARLALISELRTRGHQGIAGAADPELILRAYSTWGDDCVHHLLGDFTFAIWDGPRQRLFCARDQLGVKPFYYAHLGSRLIFSNTLDCIRLHPAVSDVLNDLAVADFLLFDMIQEHGATSFRDVQRLAPAHTLICTGETVSARRYWTLHVSTPIQHKRQGECVEQFRELLDTAVADRLRTAGAGVMMSGGLDSTTVAASAQRILGHANVPGLCAYTEIFDSLIPHEEGHYSRLVSEALKIPIEFQISDHLGIRNYLDHPESRFPEPLHSPCSDWGLGLIRRASMTRRIVLTGHGGDPALSSLLTFHFLQLIKKQQFVQAIADGMRYLTTEGRISRLYLRARTRRWLPFKSSSTHYPQWLNPDLENRLGLRNRWEDLTRAPISNRATRPVAIEAIISSAWPALFESYDSGVTRLLAEVCHPFFDLRLLNFLLALPALPWCSDKELLREAARGVLPDAVRLRRKSPLLADPLIALLQRPESEWADSFEPCTQLDKYVQRNRIPKVFKEENAWNAWINLRPLSLNFWLRPKGMPGYTNSESLRETQLTRQEAVSNT